MQKKIYQYSLDHQLVKIWDNSLECKENGFDRRNVLKCCQGKRKTHKGFVWSHFKKIDVGTDFTGVGAFEEALKRLGIISNPVFACDMDKYARQTYLANHSTPGYFPEDVNNREIPKKSLDIYMTSPPCQGFSIAGKRGGSNLFYNSLEFIRINNPRFFIFENVKGLLSHDKTNKKAKYGKTFERWTKLLGGKSVNDIPTFFSDDESVNYHIHYRVLNAKKLGVPQNRERIFIVGIRDDVDNNFKWPKEIPLLKRLKDVLEDDVNEKYFLSDKAINRLCNNDSGFLSNPKSENDIASTVCASDYKIARGMNVLKIKSGTKSGFEIATPEDSINFSFPNSKNRRGRIGKGAAQTLETSCNQAVWIADYRTDEGLRIRKDGNSPCLNASMKEPNENLSRGNCVPFVGENYKIRRLTPRECFRLMGFTDEFIIPCSDSQTYKQAGNSIVVDVLESIVTNLLL